MDRRLIPLALAAGAAIGARRGQRNRNFSLYDDDRAWMNRVAADADRYGASMRHERADDVAHMKAQGWKRVRRAQAAAEADYQHALEAWSERRAEAGPMSTLMADLDLPRPQRSDFTHEWQR